MELMQLTQKETNELLSSIDNFPKVNFIKDDKGYMISIPKIDRLGICRENVIERMTDDDLVRFRNDLIEVVGKKWGFYETDESIEYELSHAPRFYTVNKEYAFAFAVGAWRCESDELPQKWGSHDLFICVKYVGEDKKLSQTFTPLWIIPYKSIDRFISYLSFNVLENKIKPSIIVNVKGDNMDGCHRCYDKVMEQVKDLPLTEVQFTVVEPENRQICCVLSFINQYRLIRRMDIGNVSDVCEWHIDNHRWGYNDPIEKPFQVIRKAFNIQKKWYL